MILLIVYAAISRTGQASGLVNGKLLRCANKANCICTEYSDDDEHYLAAVELPMKLFDNQNRMLVVKQILLEMGGKVMLEDKDYIASIFVSSIFRFVDDVEIRFDEVKNLVHIRSSSRVGYSDFGVNKKRVDEINMKLQSSFK